MRTKRVVLPTVLAAVILAFPTVRAVAATTTASPQSADPTAAVAPSCPGGVTPAAAPREISRISPDSTFDWKDTTDVDQLSRHGYAPPAPGQSLADWVTTEQTKLASVVKTLPMWSCPGVTAGLGTGTPLTSQIWAGNQFSSGLTGHSYNQSYMDFHPPAISPDQGAQANLALWAGVGSGNSSTHQLVQAGTTEDVGSSGIITTRAFTEVYPYQSLVGLGIFVVPGYRVQVQVWTTGPLDGYFELTFTASGNFITTTGVLHTRITAPNAIVPDTAEWIAERVTAGAPENLAQWSGTINIAGQGWDSSTGSWIPAGQANHYDYHMYNGSTQIAYPAAWLDPPTYSTFPVYRTSAF